MRDAFNKVRSEHAQGALGLRNGLSKAHSPVIQDGVTRSHNVGCIQQGLSFSTKGLPQAQNGYHIASVQMCLTMPSASE